MMTNTFLSVLLACFVSCHFVSGHLTDEKVEATEECDGFKCKCYDELGCFPIRPECGEGRGTLLPQSPDDIKTQFLLFTSEKQTTGKLLTYDMSKDEFLNAGFDPSKGTKFVIHGFINSAESTGIDNIKDAFLVKGDYNVIMVDWSEGADIGLVDFVKFWTLYRQASQNTRVVAKQLYMLLDRLNSEFSGVMIFGYHGYGRKLHLIGHSLGAQIAGLAAGYLNGHIGRISGLDPAKPNFEGKDRVCRLDESDALFVDVIHSDIDYFGTEEQSGDIDFWPNGGANQPGCGIELFGCSHNRALELYAISIDGTCQFSSQPCDDSSCGSDCPTMGMHADKSSRRGNYCLSTLSDKPYC